MLDIKLIREDPERFKAAAVKKHFPDRADAVDRLLALDAQVRALIPGLDGKRSEQKAASKEMGQKMGQGRGGSGDDLNQAHSQPHPILLSSSFQNCDREGQSENGDLSPHLFL